ncbi:MAG: hypothetical protein K6G24_03180 [Lachnospiraceae bacterium]|nr:hypothetical protein [Lachnospiraceae bacterium]
MQKSKLKNEIQNSFYSEESIYAWWVEQFGYIYETGEYDMDDGFIAAFPGLDIGDEGIANCYLAMEQLVLLVAEKEGIIPQFSGSISDNEELISCKSNRMYETYPLHSAAMHAAMRTYGFEINDSYNWLREVYDVYDLSPEILKKAISRDCSKENADALWKRFCNGDIGPEELEDALQGDFYGETIYSITCPKALELERRYHKLPNLFKKKEVALKSLYNDMTKELSRVSSPMEAYEYLATETDYVKFETGEEIPIWYAPSYCENYENYGASYIIGQLEMAGPGAIFHMQEAQKLVEKFEKKFEKIERRAKKFLHNRAVKGAKARWKKYRELYT